QKTRDGRLMPFGWWDVLKALKWHKTDTVDLLLIGVLPEYRSKGANALIFNDLIPRFKEYGFKWAEAMPQMETNESVRSQWQYLDAEQHRKHRVFKRKLNR
ncbi:MAG: N-acetyltransferase, partial [Prevotella sp.]|nr:N-acetyltransferase [Prevotella sp.]